MSIPVLEVRKLTKIFQKRGWFKPATEPFYAVTDVSFTLNEGEILGLLGPNGAGKTTIAQMLLGTLTPTSGTITFFGRDFARHRSVILKSVGFASAYTRLPARLTVRENLQVYARLYGVPTTQINSSIEHFLKAFDAWDLVNKEISGLSAGQLTRIMLAKAFVSRPKVVLLDEPTASLDPDIAHEVRYFVLQQQKEEGTSIIFTSHNMDEITELCGRVLVLLYGEIIASDTPHRLAASVAQARVELIILDGMKRAQTYAQQHSLKHHVRDRLIEIEVDEKNIASLLAAFAQAGIVYSHISIEKPTLEDYFLHVAHVARQME
jgi:ABC-2 type transport system ATP-binding protein